MADDTGIESPSPDGLSAERAELLDALSMHRELLLGTVAGLTDDQARLTPTASELSLGGLVKHVTATEVEWQRFTVDGPAEDHVDWENVDWANPPPEVLARQAEFTLLEHETLEGVVAEHRRAAAHTERLVRTVDLAASQPRPAAPWFEPGARRTARRTFVHLVAEIAQHAGHADIIRETIDGQKSMG